MANKKITELDVQASYIADGELAVHPNAAAEAKRIQVDTIYPKIDALNAKTVFAVATDQLRVDNGSGDEEKQTIQDFQDQYFRGDTYEQELWSGATLYGKLVLRKVLDQVTLGYFFNNAAGTITNTVMLATSGGADIVIPTEFIPYVPSGSNDNIQFVSASLDAPGSFQMNAIGLVNYSGSWKVQLHLQDLSGTFMSKNIHGGYQAADDTIYSS